MMVGAPASLSAQKRVNSETSAYSERTVPDTAWQRLTKPPAFAYRSRREGYKATPPKPYKPSAIERFVFAIIRFFSTTVGKVLLWGILICAIGYGLSMAFFRGGRFSFAGKKKPGIEQDPTEEDLHGTAWLRLMEEAIAGQDLRLAVRYGYLHVLQALSEANRVNYRPGKTNSDYAAELAGSSTVSDFRALSRTYEYTWYGSYPITSSAFTEYRARMAQVENRSRA